MGIEVRLASRRRRLRPARRRPYWPLNNIKHYRCRGCFEDNGRLSSPEWTRVPYLALDDYLDLLDVTGMNGRSAHLFLDVVNVTMGDTQHYTVDDEENEYDDDMAEYEAIELSCIRCDRLLGWKIVEVLAGDHDWMAGKFLLDSRKIDRWRGHRRLLGYPDADGVLLAG
ncbi:uncharacterized protein LOC131148867 [Malania oleifera]|uniref:uncharacterized protein LOC131148867 n=1 Tax=Malania oleifera TaxID=397392 RepID=UPI0025AEC461|nr:uncharacterized protein LOC131148867 [Malania oleifera]